MGQGDCQTERISRRKKNLGSREQRTREKKREKPGPEASQPPDRQTLREHKIKIYRMKSKKPRGKT